MIVEEFLKLPPSIHFEGITFELQLINNGSEARLCYAILYVNDDSPHYEFYQLHSTWRNKIADPGMPPQGFLVLFEGLQSDFDLCWAIRECWYWLLEKGLLHG